MNIDEMKTFLLLSAHGNISKVSGIIGASQPAVSKLLKKIESTLGQTLFTRMPRGLKLTPSGEIVASSFLAVVDRYDLTLKQIARMKHEFEENIQVGLHPVIGEFAVPKIEKLAGLSVASFVHYHFDTSKKVAELVVEGELDFGIVADAPEYPDLVIKNLWKEHIGLYSRTGETSNMLLVNHDMMYAKKMIGMVDYSILKSINNYGLIADVVACTDAMGLLPNVKASSCGLNEIRAFAPDVDVSLIFRSDRQKTKIFEDVKSVLLKLGAHLE